ncbi:hypothetical protein LAUMK142_05689 [Mycobacterium pseudokansasii]|uniref:Uncharacterized protein n=1 Tax=Mycobacterium pseudokansasii TaxID=2341080 RepID=A0A498R1C1_9MYCO|nr:hypothetical protein LAUMK142_05689 [Mycobacterium pseudokansasii]
MVRIAAVSASDPAVRTSASAGAASLIAVCPVVAAPLPQGAGVGLKPVEAGHMRTPADAVAPGLMSAGAAGRVDAARTCEEQPADAVAAAVSGMSAGAAGRVDAARTCEEQPADAVAAAVSGMSAGAAGRVDAARTREQELPEPSRALNAELRTADRSGCCRGRRAEPAASGPEGIRRARS